MKTPTEKESPSVRKIVRSFGLKNKTSLSATLAINPILAKSGIEAALEYAPLNSD